MCLYTSRKRSAFVQPLFAGMSKLPSGDLKRKAFLNLTPGNTNTDGIVFPLAQIIAKNVTSFPLLAEIARPTLFVPLLAITLSESKTVVTPVLSKL